MQFSSDDRYLDKIVKEREPKFAHVRHVSSPADFSCIHHEDVNLVVWQRGLLPSLAQWIDQDLPAEFQLSQFELPIDLLDQKLERLVEFHWDELSPGRRMLAEDLQNLTRHFAELTSASKFNVRLEFNRKRSTSLFHMDDVPLRLLTTYAGPGTEWLDEADVDRRMLNDAKAAGMVFLNDASVQHIPRHAVALLKGRTYAGKGAKGLVHRSPPAEPKNDRPRLLFSLDPIS